MAENTREVNFQETIQAPIEEVQEEQVSEETETQEESSTPETSTEEKSDKEEPVENTEESDDSPVVPEKEPKPVEGETDRERALRLETSRLKRVLREERTRKAFEGYKPEVKEELSEEEKEILNQYDEKELGNFEKVLDVVAKKRGWVKKGDFQATTYQQQASDILDSWLETHKEYLPENDKENLLWGEFQREFALYRKPDNPRDLKRIFDKVHREVFGFSQEGSDNKISAQKEKIKVASHQGANQKSQVIRQKQSYDPSLKDHLKGFTEEEKDEILG